MLSEGTEVVKLVDVELDVLGGARFREEVKTFHRIWTQILPLPILILLKSVLIELIPPGVSSQSLTLSRGRQTTSTSLNCMHHTR